MRRALWVLAVVVPVAAALVWLGLFSPWLALQETRVDVRGIAPESAGEFPVAEVVDAVDVPLETPLLRIDTAAVTDRVAALPQVASVEVTRSWPATLVVDIERRIPVAAEAASTGEVVLVDGSGVAVVSVPALPADLPLVETTAQGRDSALAVAADLPTWLRDRTTTITATTRNDVTLELAGGSTVRWGSPDETELKATVLEALLPVGSAYYDVSAPGVPTTSDEPPGLTPSPSSSTGP